MSKQIEARDKRLKNPIFRSFAVTRDAVDEASRTVRLAFASDQPVDHWMGPLILTTKPNAVRQDRMKLGLALLDNHDRDEQIGIVENFSFDSDGIMRGDARFSKSEEADEVFQDVLDGIKRFVSVGFMIYELHVESEVNDIYTYRCDDWEPFEISIVSVPADIGVGVGRAMDETVKAKRDDGEGDGEDDTCPECEMPMAECQCEPAARNLQVSKANPPLTRAQSNSKQLEKNMENENEKPGTPVVETRTVEQIARQEVTDWGQSLGCPETATKYIQDSFVNQRAISVDGFRAYVLANKPEPTAIQPIAPAEAAKREGVVQLATSAYRGGHLRSFKGEKAEERAYRSGMFLLATIGRNEKAMEYCRTNGIVITRAQSGETNSLGGFLVPDEFDSSIIDLRIQYGAFRPNTNVVPMSSDTKTRPRRTGGLTAYFTGGGDAATESTKSWDQVTLVAKKLSVLTKYENELSEDAVINIADDLASEIAYAFANKEDLCGFNGDGSATYGGMIGVCTKILGLSATRSYIAGLQVASGNAWSEIVLSDINGVVGRLPQFARQSGNVKFYCSHPFFANVLQKLAQAVGGVTAAEIQGTFEPRFFGVPVQIVEVMPQTEANDQVCLLYGNLAQASMLGDRRGTSIAMSDSDGTDFAKGIMAIRGDTRFDINVHDVGTAAASGAVAGPIVGLLTAAS